MHQSRSRQSLSILLVISILFLFIAPVAPVVKAQELGAVAAAGRAAEPLPTAPADQAASAMSAETAGEAVPYRSTDNESYTELANKRTAFSKVYLLESKRYEAVQFGWPVHYRQDGAWLPIDNTLVLRTDAQGRAHYVNRANRFEAAFAADLGQGWLARISQDGYSLSWTMAELDQAAPAAVSANLGREAWARQNQGEQRRSVPDLSGQITYRNVQPGADLELQVIADRIKENLVLHRNTGLEQIRQTLTVTGLSLDLQTDGAIEARSAQDGKTTVFWLPRPFAVDAAGASNERITVDLAEVKAPAEAGPTDSRTYELTYTLDSAWLAAARYPVRIDPTIQTSLEQQDIKDARIAEGLPDTNYGQSYITCTGEGSSSETNYSLVRFPDLPSIGAASMVQYAGLRLTKMSATNTTSQLSIHEITESWDSLNVTWNTRPAYKSQVEDWQLVGTAANTQYEWDITRVARNWYSGGSNNGVLIKDMSATGGYKEYYASDSPSGVPPYAYFVYTNYSGLEGFWDYTSASLGRSGTASVNLYNGNLVYTHGDLGLDGNRLPVAVTHVFNSTTRSDNSSSMLYGKGWRTNYDQRVSTVTINSVDYYKYVDEDGTIHYFRQVDGVWKDESGLDLKLAVSSNVATIKDKQDNKLVFHSTVSTTKPGFLNYIEDRNGNRQTVGYDAGNRLSKVTESSGREVLFERDANGYLSKIRQPLGGSTWRDTSFTYTSARLTRITYPDGEFTAFSYDSNGNLATVTGIDSRSLALDYLSASPYRVTGLSESATLGGVTTAGASVQLGYGYNRTTLTDSQGRSAIYQFNDFGNTVSVTGPEGGAAYAGFGTSPTAGSMSKAVTASRYQKFGANSLANPSVEQTSDWSRGAGGASTGSSDYATDQQYAGARSVKLVKTNTADYQYASQWQTLIKGQTYTLSGYQKTQGVSGSSHGAYLRVGYYNAAGTIVYLTTSYLQGTNAWARQTVSFTVPADAASGDVQVALILKNSTGTAWFDGLQLEPGRIANRFNLVDNADFTRVAGGLPEAWTLAGGTASDIVQTSATSTNPVTNDDNRFRLYGDPDLAKTLTQDLALAGNAGDTYVAGGWARGASVPLSSGRRFAVRVYFDYTDPARTDEWKTISFSEDSQIWQFACGAVVAQYAYQAMKIRVEYTDNANSADFDAISLYREAFGNTYAYDDNGNLTRVTDASAKDEQFQYSANNDLTQYIDPSGKAFTYTYDAKHNILTATSATGTVYTYTYDSYGNQLSARVGDATDYVRSTVSYDSAGNFTDHVTDPFGEQTDYSFDPYKGTLTSVTDPLGNTVSHTYAAGTDALTQTSQTSGGITMRNSYTYLDDRLTQVTHTAPAGSQGYDFTYNSLGWATGVRLAGASTDLVTYSLQDRTGRLDSLDYGNGQSLDYTYDTNDQLQQVSLGSASLYAYAYDNSGNLGYVDDQVSQRQTWFEYDSLDRLGLVRTIDSAGNATASRYSFNSANNLSSFQETIRGASYETTFSYDDDSRPLGTSFGSFSQALDYDSFDLGRLVYSTIRSAGTDLYQSQIKYKAVSNAVSTRTYRIHQIVNDVGGSNETLTYTYDARGSITQVARDAANYSDYRYDGFNQLVRENYQWDGASFSMVYSYDVGGNLTGKVRYAFVAGDGALGTPLATISCSYADSAWPDKLTSYNAQAISYDAIGNPLSDGTWTYTWTQGRRLQQMASASTTLSFKYDDQGIRTAKTVNGVTTVYHLVGDRVTWEQTGTNNPIYYLYDAAGSLWGLRFSDGNTYFYVRNAQGDIIKLVDSTGAEAVSYSYDAWGNPTLVSGALANTLGQANPYRYRGYRYDTETGLYYLQSRYYDPEWGRFINADDTDVLDGGNDHLLENNLFAYCFNNPVNQTDENGNWPSWATKVLIGTAIIAAAAVLTVATAGTGTALACFAYGALQGAMAGAAIGAASGAASGAIIHRVSTGRWRGAGQAALNGAADGYMWGAATGFVSGGLTSNVCFVAGTAVLAASGSVAIETIRAGDLVWAEDPETGEKALKSVAQTFVNETHELVHVFVNGEEIITTPEHPFYVPQKGWTGAIHLRAGDILVLSNGQYVTVEKIQHELLETVVKVYNFEVEDFHSYFVGNVSVLVHNTCNANSLKTLKPAQGYRLVDKKTGEILKYGETTMGKARYSQKYLQSINARMEFMTNGSKYDMHYWQNNMIENYAAITGQRPPLNKSFW